MMDVSKADFFRTTRWLGERDFESIFQEHYPRVYSVVYRMVGDPHAADDLTAETFWRLWEHPPARDENLAGWLYRVATRLGYNALRDRRRREQYELAALDAALRESPSANPAQAAENRMERERVRRVLRRLPYRDFQLLVLRHSGLSYREIAAAAGIAAASVGTLLNRAESRFEALYRQGEKDAPE